MGSMKFHMVYSALTQSSVSKNFVQNVQSGEQQKDFSIALIAGQIYNKTVTESPATTVQLPS